MLCALLLAGCGGDGDSSSAAPAVRPSGPPLTKAEYEKRFKAVVASSERRAEGGGDSEQVRGYDLGIDPPSP